MTMFPMNHARARRVALALIWLCGHLMATPAVAQDGGGDSPAPAEFGFGAASGAIWISTADSHFRNYLKIDRFIDNVRRLPFRDLIIHVRIGAQAFYDSEIVPRALGVPESLDPLDYLLTHLQERGDQRVIAWISPYHAGNVDDAAEMDPLHVRNSHPEWLSRRYGGEQATTDGSLFLEPGLPAVQAHIEAVIQDLLRNYPVSGLYIDPMHDPDVDWGFHPEVIEAWQRETGAPGMPGPGDPSWVAFRNSIMTRALEGFVAAAREVRPDLPVSTGALTYGPAPLEGAAFPSTIVYRQYHQNWPLWLERALVDELYLKNFKVEASGAQDFDLWLQLAKVLADDRVELICGVAGRYNESIDALRQMRRAVEMGILRLALADYQAPVRDRGSRELFMTAIGMTVLSPEYLDRMAMLRDSGLSRQADIEEQEILAPLIEAQAEPVEQLPEPGPPTELPPPPSIDGEATTESPRTVLTPVIRGEAQADAEPMTEDELRRETLEALRELSGLATDDMPEAEPGEAPAEDTRAEALRALIRGSDLRGPAEDVRLDPNAESREYLRRRFPNIFN